MRIETCTSEPSGESGLDENNIWYQMQTSGDGGSNISKICWRLIWMVHWSEGFYLLDRRSDWYSGHIWPIARGPPPDSRPPLCWNNIRADCPTVMTTWFWLLSVSRGSSTHASALLLYLRSRLKNSCMFNWALSNWQKLKLHLFQCWEISSVSVS